MSQPRRIAIFSGKRGGFGAYMPFMKLVASDPDLELQIILGDMHASVEFGRTLNEALGYFPNSKIETVEMGTGRGDTPEIRVENLATCLSKAPRILRKLNPDILMVHGDRGEHLIMALAANNLGIPVGHTQGGESSGNVDDIQRHAITKLAHLHFPETEKAAKKIRELGEKEDQIHIVGSLYVDRIVKKMYTDPKAAMEKYGLKNGENYFIIIFHPDTFESAKENYQTAKAVLSVVRDTGLRAVVVHPCSDPGYQSVILAINEALRDFPTQFLAYKNIDNLDFLGLMASAKAIIGNSSAAFVEAPYFQVPALNTGNRQRGRDREENVIEVGTDINSIKMGLQLVLSPTIIFQNTLRRCGYRLGDGRSSEKIVEILKRVTLDQRLLRK